MPVEAKAFYVCRNRRCRVRHWPVEAGDRCPICGLSGEYAGTVVRETHDPPDSG